uniref:Uncharacterized protein n=1 Tax=Rhizophora mucronata TaxID=61149 RepID=A0A2P2ISS7_RHIMU
MTIEGERQLSQIKPKCKQVKR